MSIKTVADQIIRDAGLVPPVDRSQTVPVAEDHRDLRPDGQQKAYVVLSDEERARGFVRPVRKTYLHVGHGAEFKGAVLIQPGKGACGTRTTMGSAIAETYARDPAFYSGTFCVSCGKHLPLDEFIWEGTQEIVGS